MDEKLSHTLPRLDAPDKISILPAPAAKWLAAGLFTVPAICALSVTLLRVSQQHVWGNPLVWVLWGLCVVIGCVGAIYRPGGLGLDEWLRVLINYYANPRNPPFCAFNPYACRHRLGQPDVYTALAVGRIRLK